MASNFDYAYSGLPTPESSPVSQPDSDNETYAIAKERAITALSTVLENAPQYTNGERQTNALVSLSASLLSMLVKFGSDRMCEQAIFDLTEFVLDAFDAAPTEDKRGEDLAGYIFKYVDETDSTAPSNPTAEDDATAITPDEDMEATVEPEEEQMEVVAESPVKQVSRREHNPPALNYDPAPIAQVGSRLLCDMYGSEDCPDTVPNYTPTLAEYISDAITSARLERSVAIYALTLISRLRPLNNVSITHGTYGLFITAFMIAGKVLADSPYSANAWYRVGREIFTLEQLGEMERAMCAESDWKFVVVAEDLESSEASLFERFGDEVESAGPQTPTDVPGSPVVEQTTPSPPSSNPLATSSTEFDHSSPIFSPPRTPASSGSSSDGAFNRSPRWTPPSPSAFRSTPSHQAEPRIPLDKKWSWVEYDPTGYENEGYDDEESDEESDEEFF